MRSLTLRGGFQPKIAGRPSGAVRPISVPNNLTVSLQCQGIPYAPQVSAGPMAGDTAVTGHESSNASIPEYAPLTDISSAISAPTLSNRDTMK